MGAGGMCFPIGAAHSSPHHLFDWDLLKGPFKSWQKAPGEAGRQLQRVPAGLSHVTCAWGVLRDVGANLVRCLFRARWEMALGESLG